MTVTDPVDFMNVAEESGENITIYNGPETLGSSGSLATQSLGNGIIEKAIIQPESLNNIARSEGRITQGDLFAMFKNSSVVTKDSLVKINATLQLFKVKNFVEIRPSGAIHHIECNLEYLRDMDE